MPLRCCRHKKPPNLFGGYTTDDIISVSIIVYANTVSMPIVSKAAGGLVLYSICSEQDSLADSSVSSCDKIKDMDSLIRIDASIPPVY